MNIRLVTNYIITKPIAYIIAMKDSTETRLMQKSTDQILDLTNSNLVSAATLQNTELRDCEYVLALTTGILY